MPPAIQSRIMVSALAAGRAVAALSNWGFAPASAVSVADAEACMNCRRLRAPMRSWVKSGMAFLVDVLELRRKEDRPQQILQAFNGMFHFEKFPRHIAFGGLRIACQRVAIQPDDELVARGTFP